MKRTVASVFSVCLLMAAVFAPFTHAAQAQVETDIGIQYRTHIQDKGWEAMWKRDGSLSGTVGEGKRIEGIRVELTGRIPKEANIQAFVHVQNKGDLGPFKMGEVAGTNGQGLRLESLKLVLNNLPGYRLKYNVQVQNKGWLNDEYDDTNWFRSGETAGTAGESLRLEAIRIKLVKANEEYEAYQATLSSVNEINYTGETWSAYQDVVNENVVTEDNTAAEIIVATNNIIEAQKKLIRGKNFSFYNAALAAAKEIEYTPETWADYDAVVQANKVSEANTQTEINKATGVILEAQKKLQKKVNITDYKELLDAVRETDYTAGSWTGYQAVLAKNMMTENNTQTEIEAAIKAISEAQKKMVRKFDFTAYNALLNSVKEEDYISSTWATYQAVVKKNQVTENNTQTDIEAAIRAISEAQKKLVRSADLSEYNVALSAVNKNDYTTASWKEYQRVLQSIIIKQSSKQEDVDKAVAKIQAAQLNLVRVGDMVEYNEVLNTALQSKPKYTSASWAIYQKVVDANVVTAFDGQTAIDQATEKIRAAQKKLVSKGDPTRYYEVIAAKNKDDYTQASWAVYQKVLDANETAPEKTQSELDAAVEKILVAQKKLIPRVGADIWAQYQALVGLKIEADYTPASWTVYKKVLTSNAMNREKSQADVEKAMSAIRAAQDNLVPRVGKEGWAAYQALVALKNETAHTPTSWTAYQKILDANKMTPEKSQAEIDTAMLKIQTAQKNLVPRVGDEVWTKYQALVDAKKETAFTAASWATYKKVLLTNTMNREKSQAEVEKAMAAIKVAQDILVPRVGDEVWAKYQALVDAKKETAFTAASWATYKKVLLTNTMNREKSQVEVEKAMAAIKVAQDNLVLRVGDEVWAKYRVLVDLKKETDYTPASWLIYQKILDTNEMTPEKSQKEVEAAMLKIENAQKKLVARVSADILASYQTLLAKVNEADYTVVSWTAYKKVVAANAMSKEKSQAEVEKANWTIENAQSDLVRKGVLTEYDLVLSDYDTRQNDFTTKAWSDYQKVINANLMTTENTQLQIDTAVAKIKRAQATLRMYQAAIMTAYNDVLKATEGKQADYTPESWKTYQEVVNKNAKTRDNTQEEVNAAANIISDAQKKLVLANADELKAFQKVLELYQEELINPGSISGLATEFSWGEYQKIVLTNAAFDGDGNWVPTVINRESAKELITLTTAEIEEMLRALEPKAGTLDFTDYDTLRTRIPWDGSVAEQYTKSTYAQYVSFCEKQEIRIRILATQEQIDNAVTLIQAAQSSSMLKDRAEADQVVAFETEFALFRTFSKTNYTPNSWLAYENAYTRYSLKPDENSGEEYDAATTDLATKRGALVFTATYIVNNTNVSTVTLGELAEGQNILTRVKSLLTAHGYKDTTHSVTFAKTAGNAVIANDGTITTKNDGATVTFTITSNDTSAPSKTTAAIVLNII